ncbi:MAG: hypothetical protein LBI02_11405 [Opitutaceae bacterium]|nr:hypothetical protein [Opitutaceae bacterium]
MGYEHHRRTTDHATLPDGKGRPVETGDGGMTTPVCPKCGKNILGDDINVARDVAYCRKCGTVCALSELAESHRDRVFKDSAFDLAHPPKGAWLRRDMRGISLGASCRSFQKAAGLLFTALFWNGIVSVFVCLAIAGTLHYAGISVPEWVPAFCGEEGDGLTGSLGGLLFLWLFLTPFILIGTGMIVSLLMSLFGRVEITIQADTNTGRVFSGLGRVGWTRKFIPSRVGEIGGTRTRWTLNGASQELAFLREKDGEMIKFGLLLSEERRAFLIYALERILAS